MLRPPPSSTLFPYTTLFRSLLRDLPSSRTRLHPFQMQSSPPPSSRGEMCPHESEAFSPTPEPLLPLSPDRKSTRLNSSHSSISYAVFCLKKKKQHKINTETN